MGYYTQHTLNVRNLKSVDDFVSLSNELKARDLIGYAFDDGHYTESKKTGAKEATFYPYDEVKWYDHAQHMVMISEKFPNLYFELAGNGEEFGDYWKEYYHDGEIECCRGEIVYEEPKKIQWNDLIPF